MKGVAIIKSHIVHAGKAYFIEEVMNGQIGVRNAKIMRIGAGTEFPGHRHPYYEAAYIISGEMRYRFSDGEYTLPPGELMIKCPNIWHAATVPVDTVVFCFAEQSFVASDFNNFP